MSAESLESDRSDAGSTGESSSGSRVNPTNWPDHLRQYRTVRPDEPGARETQDPHEWDDPDPGILERISPDTTLGWLLAWALGLITLALAAYLVPIFVGWVLDPVVIGGLVVASVILATYVKGRVDGIGAYRELDKSVIYYGDEADVRLGRETGSSGPEKTFTPLRDFSLAGFKIRYLLKRDLGYDVGKLRSYQGTDVGSEHVEDALNKTTVEVNTETVGKVLVTHASDLEHAGQSTDVDRYTPLPDRFDADVAEDVQILVRRLRRKIKELKADAEELERAAEDARDLRNKQLAPELEQTLVMINALQSAVDDDDTGGRKEDSAGIEAIRESAEKQRNRNGWSS